MAKGVGIPGICRFGAARPRAEVFSIDTPPPTVSGSLHVGHVFSYAHTDIIARHRRMAGQTPPLTARRSPPIGACSEPGGPLAAAA